MLGQHFVRVGALGAVGRFVAEGAERYPRGARVVCRTERGLEVGEVLSAIEAASNPANDGTLLRRITPQDDLLLAREAEIQKVMPSAFIPCDRQAVAYHPICTRDSDSLADATGRLKVANG